MALYVVLAPDNRLAPCLASQSSRGHTLGCHFGSVYFDVSSHPRPSLQVPFCSLQWPFEVVLLHRRPHLDCSLLHGVCGPRPPHLGGSFWSPSFGRSFLAATFPVRWAEKFRVEQEGRGNIFD